MATATHTDWMAVIVEQLGTIDDDPKLTHAVVYLPADRDTDEPDLLDRCDSKTAALVSAEDWATKVGPGEVTIVPLADLLAWHRDNGYPVELDPILHVEPRRQNVDDDPPARELEQEDGEPDQEDETPAVPEPQPGEQAAAFDASDYDREDLQIPKIDGEEITKIRVKFSGSVMLDRSEPADVALFNRLRLGKDVELRCAGTVKGVGTGYTTNRDGDLDVVVGEKTVNVGTVWVLEPEELRA